MTTRLQLTEAPNKEEDYLIRKERERLMKRKRKTVAGGNGKRKMILPADFRGKLVITGRHNGYLIFFFSFFLFFGVPATTAI